MNSLFKCVGILITIMMKKLTKKQAIAIGGGAIGVTLIWKLVKKKFGKKRKEIYIDFDGTICKNKFPDVGEPEPNVSEVFKQIIRKYDIVIHSCRTAKYWKKFVKDHKPEEHVKVIENFMKKHDIPYTRIETDHDKPFAYKYVGDEALQYTGDWKKIFEEL